MKRLVSAGPIFWPNGIGQPTMADAVEAAYRLLSPAPNDYRSSNDRAKSRLLFTGTGVRRAISRSAVIRDQSISSSNPTNHILGIPIVEDPELSPNVYQFRDVDGNVLHTGILCDD